MFPPLSPLVPPSIDLSSSFHSLIFYHIQTIENIFLFVVPSPSICLLSLPYTHPPSFYPDFNTKNHGNLSTMSKKLHFVRYTNQWWPWMRPKTCPLASKKELASWNDLIAKGRTTRIYKFYTSHLGQILGSPCMLTKVLLWSPPCSSPNHLTFHQSPSCAIIINVFPKEFYKTRKYFQKMFNSMINLTKNNSNKAYVWTLKCPLNYHSRQQKDTWYLRVQIIRNHFRVENTIAHLLAQWKIINSSKHFCTTPFCWFSIIWRQELVINDQIYTTLSHEVIFTE